MCGRAKLATDYSELKIVFSLPEDLTPPNWAPNWNLAPTQTTPIVRLDEGRRVLELARFGLLPAWAKDEKIAYSTFNARSEALETKPAFRDAWKRCRRCLIPIDNFYEWKALDENRKVKQPYAIALPDRQVMALAGLWDTWRSPAGEMIRSMTIITTEPSGEMASIHNRMPVILPPAAWPAWLGEHEATNDEIAALLRPFPEHLVIWPVGRDVGNVRNNHAGLVEPIAI